MSSFQVVAIPTEVAQQVRATGKSPIYGFPAHREIAAGRAPCRHCLQLIQRDQEELLLFTYDPFRELSHLHSRGLCISMQRSARGIRAASPSLKNIGGDC